MMRLTSLAAFAASSALALNNGLGRTPQMGYNSWYDMMMNPSDALLRETVTALKQTGLW
jgi:alpha-galactosidase